MIDQLLNAALAPLYQPLGWQALAYGLLGVETIKRTVRTVVSMRQSRKSNE